MKYADIFVIYCTECEWFMILEVGESADDHRCEECGAVMEGE